MDENIDKKVINTCESEDKYYEMIGNDYEKRLNRFNNLLNECSDRLFYNKIAVIDYNEAFDSEFTKQRFIEDIEKLSTEEDFVNFRLSPRIEDNKENEIIVVYPVAAYSENDNSQIKVQLITSLPEFIEKVIYMKENNGYKTFYRGHGNWKYELVPGIYREDNIHILENESDYNRDIIASYPKYFNKCKSALDFLSVLQHHGFPTRLLDFSENPLIALYMACSSDNKQHSDVIRINVPNSNFKYYDSDTVSVLSNIAFVDKSFSIDDFQFNSEDLKENIRLFNEHNDIRKLVHLIRNEKPFFKPEIYPEHLDGSILFVKQKQEFDRITHQKGLFALFGINKNKQSVPKVEYMIPSCNITHFIIPSKCKKRIIEELSRININEATVYCDMDHIANYYKTKSKTNEINNMINKDKEELLKLI